MIRPIWSGGGTWFTSSGPEADLESMKIPPKRQKNSGHLAQRWKITQLSVDCIYIWLVVSTPLKDISQMGLLFPIYGKIKLMFQTTSQYEIHIYLPITITYLSAYETLSFSIVRLPTKKLWNDQPFRLPTWQFLDFRFNLFWRGLSQALQIWPGYRKTTTTTTTPATTTTTTTLVHVFFIILFFLKKLVYKPISGWWLSPTSLKNMKVSWDDSSQYMEKHVPNHQPDM